MEASKMEEQLHSHPPNGSHGKLQTAPTGVRRTEACRLPRAPLNSEVRSATGMTP
jgi:hypothetical protein